ncbi:MAG: antA/AntB antirepressor family protein [Clostridiales bacterium]|nr:antA/AntB antirepressor family protein [Clostridiales bacterium]
MNEIIKVDFDSQTVSARELHEKLKIGTKFATWFPRMTEYGFSEGTDYETCYPNLGSENHGGQNMIDYQISVDMAKQILIRKVA